MESQREQKIGNGTETVVSPREWLGLYGVYRGYIRIMEKKMDTTRKWSIQGLIGSKYPHHCNNGANRMTIGNDMKTGRYIRVYG